MQIGRTVLAYDEEPEAMIPVSLLENCLLTGPLRRLNDREKVILTIMAMADYDSPGRRGATEEVIADYSGYSRAEVRYGIAGLVRKGRVVREVRLIDDKATPFYYYNREA